MKTIEELEKEIIELKQTISALVKEKNAKELLDFPWVGNLGNWVWHVKSNKVYFNDGKVNALGYKRSELDEEINYQFFTEKLHSKDYDRVMQNMTCHLEGKSEAYEVEYRIQAKSGDYRWFYDRGKITHWDKEGSPLILAGIVFDITQKKTLESSLREANRKLADMAVYDDLTKLLNRRMIYERIVTEYNRCTRYDDTFCLIMFDLDYFKHVNDTCGHDVGDKVLTTVSQVVSSQLRNTDTIGRWGGEEFIICLPKTDVREALRLGERLRSSIESINVPPVERITASFGIVDYNQKKNLTLEQLIKQADHNMYVAKRRVEIKFFINQSHNN